MNNEFTVINSTDEDKSKEMDRVYRVAKLNECWERQYYTAMEKACTGENGKIKDLTQDELAKIGFAGIKYICSMREIARENMKLGIDESRTLAQEQLRFTVIDGIFTILSCLTLRNFVNIFPVEKRYDGEKWEEKDYFYTMDVLSKMDLDKPIERKNMLDFLWGYENRDLRAVCVEYMKAISALYREQTGKSIAEKWCEDNGIRTYTKDMGTGLVKDNQTGAIMKMPEKSHIEIVE